MRPKVEPDEEVESFQAKRRAWKSVVPGAGEADEEDIEAENSTGVEAAQWLTGARFYHVLASFSNRRNNSKESCASTERTLH